MVRKALLACLVLFGVLFFQSTVECFAQLLYEKEGLSNSARVDLLYSYVTAKWPEDAIWQQMHVAMTNIADGNEAGAQAAIDKLRTGFSQNQYLPVALHEIAKLYRLINKHQKGLELHRYVIDKWPKHEYTMWSLRDVVIITIALGDLEAAQAAANRALTDFSNNIYIAFVGYDMAGYYKDFKYYAEAKKLYEYVIKHWPEQTDYVRWCQTGLVEANLGLANQAAVESEIKAQVNLAKACIANGDMEAAEAAINTLLTNYPANPFIARPLFDIAEHCRQFDKYEKALQLYKYVVDNWPQHASARWSQSGVAICDIALGNIQAAEAAADKLLANYPKNELMANCVYDIAQQYSRSEKYEKAEQLYQYVLDNWPNCEYVAWTKIGLAQTNIRLGKNTVAEGIIDGLVIKLSADYPLVSNLPPKAAQTCYDSGNCYTQLGKYEKARQCYERVVNGCPDYEYAWNAQYMIGLNYETMKKEGTISASEADMKIKTAYEQLLARYPNCPVAEHASDWLNLNISK
jgi:tetratricopeptide (TPR) repeat protein